MDLCPFDELQTAHISINAEQLATQLDNTGFAVIPSFICEKQCTGFSDLFYQQSFRKTVQMARHRFGVGTYKYWDYPLPPEVQLYRQFLYPILVPIANQWMARLQIERRYPQTLEAMTSLCKAYGQTKPTPLLLKYDQGGHNTLHQDLYGEVHFPLQAAIFLSKKDTDYTGGEFVLTEQIPRAQSKVTVLRPDQGDLVIFSTNYRPLKGKRGYYRGIMKHGVSEVVSGQRFVLGIIFHDADS